MKNPRFPRRAPPTREELEALQQERLERIDAASHVPWNSLILAALAALLSIAVMGGGISSLLLATVLVTLILARGFRQKKPRQ